MDARAGTGTARLGRFRADLLAMARRDRVLYLLALTALVTGFAMQPVTGNRPDWGTVLKLSERLLLIGGMVIAVAVVWRLGWLAVVARSRRPTRDLARWLAGLLGADGLAANALHTLALFLVFGAGFAVLKGAVAVAAPFAWDVALAELDRVLHLGRYPHEYLWPLLDRPAVVFAVNFAYNLWFLVLVASFLAAAAATRRPALRHQYLMSFMLVWFVGGFLIAMAFSSAGPCFYAQIGLGELYAPLMDRLHAADARHEIWAVDTQEALWAGFTGERPGSAGISAFPSMHVATATLFVLAARRLKRWVYAAAAAFWLLIMLGSVLLAWHYAVDGYAGALIAAVAWRLCGLYARRSLADAEPARAGA
jgi:membrane-associated phospholipid phosphatase